MRFETKAIHAGQPPDPSTGAVIPPIYQTSTYVVEAPGKDKGYVYARTSNPTRTALEKNLAALENGEYGLGFSVGAREIRRLADQTAVATLDIEQMVKEMHSAVSSGIMEMDKFVQRVKKGADDVGRIGGGLAAIIDQVQGLIPLFVKVTESVKMQSEGAAEISEAMNQLSESVVHTKSSLHEFATASGQLSEAVQGLQSEVANLYSS